MSDNQMPAWANAFADMLEMRILPQVSNALAATEERLGQRIDELRAEMNRRFDQTHDDIAVTMARADGAHTKVDSDRAEVAGIRKEMSTLYRRLQDIERRLFKEGGG